jgi:hypothetical protein
MKWYVPVVVGYDGVEVGDGTPVHSAPYTSTINCPVCRRGHSFSSRPRGSGAIRLSVHNSRRYVQVATQTV